MFFNRGGLGIVLHLTKHISAKKHPLPLLGFQGDCPLTGMKIADYEEHKQLLDELKRELANV